MKNIINNILSYKNLLKYSIFTGIIYSILKSLPDNKLKNKDMLLVIFIIISGFVSLDCLLNDNVEKMTNTDLDFESDLTLLDENIYHDNMIYYDDK